MKWLLGLLAVGACSTTADDLSITAAKALLRKGQVDQVLFVLDHIAKDKLAADPTAEHYLRAAVFLKKDEIAEAQSELRLAREALKAATTASLYAAPDIDTLQRDIDIQVDAIDYSQLPLFGRREAQRAAREKQRPHIELRAGLYRVSYGDKNFRTPSVAEFYKLMRAAMPSKTYKAEFHHVRLDYGRARSDQVLYDEADELKPPSKTTDGEDTFKTVELRPLSLVGNLFVYKSESIEDNAFTGGTLEFKGWVSMDFKTGRAAEILDYADTASLAKALKEAPALQHLKGWPPVDGDQKPVDDDATIARFKNEISQKDPLDFAVAAYDLKTNTVTLEINWIPKQASGLKQASQILEVRVQPTVVFQKQLVHLSHETGFFISEAPEL